MSKTWIDQTFGTVRYGLVIDPNEPRFQKWLTYKAHRCTVVLCKDRDCNDYHPTTADAGKRRCRRYAVYEHCDMECGRQHIRIPDEFLVPGPCYWNRLPTDLIAKIVGECPSIRLVMMRVCRRFNQALSLDKISHLAAFADTNTLHGKWLSTISAYSDRIDELICDSTKVTINASAYVAAYKYVGERGGISDQLVCRVFTNHGLDIMNMHPSTLGIQHFETASHADKVKMRASVNALISITTKHEVLTDEYTALKSRLKITSLLIERAPQLGGPDHAYIASPSTNTIHHIFLEEQKDMWGGIKYAAKTHQISWTCPDNIFSTKSAVQPKVESSSDSSDSDGSSSDSSSDSSDEDD